MNDWIEVIPPKKAKRAEKKKIEERWKKLEEICPHIMTPQKIADVCKRINISNLENKLKSEEWIEYQLSGWIYQKVLTNVEEINGSTYGYSNTIPKCISEEFSTLPVQNKWGDVVLFKRYNNTPSL